MSEGKTGHAISMQSVDGMGLADNDSVVQGDYSSDEPHGSIHTPKMREKHIGRQNESELETVHDSSVRYDANTLDLSPVQEKAH